MIYFIIIAFATKALITTCERDTSYENTESIKFPDYFKFGVSSSAYQIEGAWNEDGRGESIWDYAFHYNPNLTNHESGDIACDSYNQYKEDLKIIGELGVETYRFSISWTRILPNGFTNNINIAGIEYYNKLINGLLKINVEPIVTIYHWDLPKNLQDLGGFTNELSIKWYTDYACILFDLYGDRVKTWITFNEPSNICHNGYAGVLYAPFIQSKGIAEYLCTKNILLAHATVWHIYDKVYRARQNGALSMSLNSEWYVPLNQSVEDDNMSARKAIEFELGIFAHAIFSEDGDFPPLVKSIVETNSLNEGYSESRLPELSREEVEFIRGTGDFFALNSYSTYYVTSKDCMFAENLIYPSYMDIDLSYCYDRKWPQAASAFVFDVPWGMLKLLTHIRDVYCNPEIRITENGWADKGGRYDHNRINAMTGILNAIHQAMQQGIDVRSYNVWSLMDNLEWTAGTSVRFGLYEVDFNDPHRARRPKLSAYYYKDIIKTRIVPYKNIET